MACNNNQTEYCGGPSRLNMYVFGNGTLPSVSQPVSGSPSNTVPTPSSSSIPAAIGQFNYVSCYTEATNGRALTGFALADNSISLDTCASNCTGFRYFGVEYARGK